MRVVFISPSMPPEVREIDGSLQSFRDLVGGHLEALPFMEGSYAFIDEEAKVKDGPPPPPNLFATQLMEKLGPGLWPGDIILGPMVIVGAPDDEGNEQDAPPHVIESVLNFKLE